MRLLFATPGANDKWLIQSVEMTLRALYERRRVLLLRASQGGDLGAEGSGGSESGDDRDALQVMQTSLESDRSEATEGGGWRWSPAGDENARARDEPTSRSRDRSLESERTPASVSSRPCCRLFVLFGPSRPMPSPWSGSAADVLSPHPDDKRRMAGHLFPVFRFILAHVTDHGPIVIVTDISEALQDSLD